jgi:hypothetical protein
MILLQVSTNPFLHTCIYVYIYIYMDICINPFNFLYLPCTIIILQMRREEEVKAEEMIEKFEVAEQHVEMVKVRIHVYTCVHVLCLC